LHFLGANQQVTGSRYVLEAGGLRVMIDCGMFQERCCLDRNWGPSPVPPGDVDYLLLTHAHLDHCGLIPRFVGEGFGNPILATAPSIDLARLVLEDSARIQEEDAGYKRKRHRRERRKGPHPEIPLYTSEEVQSALRLLRLVTYGKTISLNDHVEVQYHDAGHILGSAMLEVTAKEAGQSRRLVFSGDIGQRNRPLVEDPAVVTRADFVVMESTYGDRDHESSDDVLDRFAQVVNDTVERGGNVVIPTFAIDRAQAILFYLAKLVADTRIPRMTTFLDSPMAIDATGIYKDYKHLLDDETHRLLERGEHPFQFAGLHFVRNSRESRAINSIQGSCIIMAGSGMCTGGRVKHHLRQNIGRPESTVLFVGYQGRETLGRAIVDGARKVRIHGRKYPVRAKIEQLHGLSAHGDRTDLLRWLGHFASPPRRVFLTHGDADAALELARQIEQRLNWNTTVPEYLDVVDLD
jgi:metallo-beta-lactamase family protein